MIREQSDSKSELFEMARNICNSHHCETFVFWFPIAIPQRGVVVDIEGAAQYAGKAYAKQIYACSYERQSS